MSIFCKLGLLIVQLICFTASIVKHDDTLFLAGIMCFVGLMVGSIVSEEAKAR